VGSLFTHKILVGVVQFVLLLFLKGPYFIVINFYFDNYNTMTTHKYMCMNTHTHTCCSVLAGAFW